MDASPWTLPTWVKIWDDPTENYGLGEKNLRPPFYKRDVEIAQLELQMMWSEAEYHANWGV